MKEPINKGTNEEFIPRIRWKEIEHYIPFRISITDWKGLTIVKYGVGQFLLLPSEMQFNRKKIELCVPYDTFIRRLREMPISEQKAIISGTPFELIKTYMKDNWGMRIAILNNR